MRLPDDGDTTLRQLRMLALLWQVDETDVLQRLVRAEAERAAGPAPKPMSEDEDD